jgi:hypothetical protein
MEGYGGPAQPSPTIGECLNGGLGWLEVECNRCKTRASLPLDAIRRPTSLARAFPIAFSGHMGPPIDQKQVVVVPFLVQKQATAKGHSG